MSKYFKKSRLLMVIACVAMMLCVSVGVSAVDPGSYTQGNGTSDAINVTVTVEGLSIPYTEIPVSLPAKTSGTQKVIDALVAADAANSSIGFFESYTDEDEVVHYTSIDSETTYFTHVANTSVTPYVYDGGSGSGYSGWVFRIDGAFPVDANGWGTTVATAVIENGDKISFYVDNPFSESTIAMFSKISASYSNGVVNATAVQSYQYYTGANWDWTVTDFEALPSVEVAVYNSANQQIGDIGYTDDNGNVSINTGNLPAGTYTVKVLGAKDSTAIYYTTATTTFTVQ